jgi:hypothetical protein
VSHSEDESSESVARPGVPIKHFGVEDVVAVYVDHASVSQTGGMFTITLFQTQIPLVLQPGELATLENVPAKCVAKLVLTTAFMVSLFQTMQGQLGSGSV